MTSIHEPIDALCNDSGHCQQPYQPGCIAAGLVLPAKGEMQKAQFTKAKNTAWVREESILLDLHFPAYSLYYTYIHLYMRTVLKLLMSVWLSFKNKKQPPNQNKEPSISAPSEHYQTLNKAAELRHELALSP